MLNSPIMLPADIESRIRPLVEALNQTGLVQTFSSCEGHFEPSEQILRDRNHAEVRFIPSIAEPDVERAMGHWLAHFKERHGLMPVTVVGYKLFTPLDVDLVEVTFVLEVRPFNRFDPPAIKRADIDRALDKLVAVINSKACV